LVTIGLLAQQAATEAPAGFDTLTLQNPNAASQSSSNRVSEPPGDTFARDQQVFEKRAAKAAPSRTEQLTWRVCSCQQGWKVSMGSRGV
jgi:hypothetical protein